MSRTKTETRRRPATAATTLPDADEALRRLAAGHGRALGSLVVRLISCAFLIALLTVQVPALRGALPLVNAAGVALVAWPFFTSTGRLYGWRIALGRRYADAGRWEEAARTLAPLGMGVRAALFDAAGEGRYLLALAWRSLGRGDDARRLWGELATQYARTEWGTLSAERLATEEGKP